MVSRERPKTRRKRRRVLFVCIAVVVPTLTAIIILLMTQALKPPASVAQTEQSISSSVYDELTDVPFSTLRAVGAGQNVNPPQSVSGPPLTNEGKPEVLYIGGEYCPYCAVERWSMIIALSQFGNLSGLQYMVSSSTDIPSSIATFTFRSATYSSQYISFVPVEEWNRSGAVVQSPTPNQQSLMSTFDQEGSIPFIDFANEYTVVGAQVGSPTIISNRNWTQIASQLDQPASIIGSSLDAAANTMISAMCKIDGVHPARVCAQSFGTLPLSFARPHPGTSGSGESLALPETLGKKEYG